MKDGPNIANIAALIGDRARADALCALMSGMALTATELADEAAVTRQTMSTHLARMVDAGLLAVEAQGRHRYFRLAGEDVAGLLESLMGVAYRAGAVRLRSSPREPALRRARVCYDHLAGELGVLMFDNLSRAEAFAFGAEGLSLTETGRGMLERLGVRDAGKAARRPACRTCLDWSERRHHLAGTVGSALLDHFIALGWAHRVAGTRVVAFTDIGEQRLRAWSSGQSD